MDFKIYDQNAILNDPVLLAYMLDTTVENMNYIFGSDMGSKENREIWIHNNLRTNDPSWQVVIGGEKDLLVGFIVYTVRDGVLSVCDIEVDKNYRFTPGFIIGIFRFLFAAEKDRFKRISGYINKANTVSMDNFLKYATSVTEKARGYSFEIDEAATQSIKNKLIKNR